MNFNLLTKWANNKYNRFLFLLFWLLVSIALPESRVVTTCTILILFLATMLSTVRQIRPNQRWLKYYAALVLLNIALLGLQMFGVVNISAWSHGYSITALIFLVVIFVPIFLLQQEFFLAPRVTADTLKGGIAIYVLMGVAWSMVYTILFDFNPDSFAGVQLSQVRADLLHFSFVTLTTVGYGNILPMGPLARVASDLEAIAGIMYPAILISRLVSRYTSNSEKPSL
ncbi:potassium channel family protein [Leptolyngbya ohadii]|uniref:potassium channel family protein n=1 Tax=Leptolyngbya ohadii TaxID=1962290 RepID=UPI000B59A94A|nr:potassium channel family protein [Leptolyngbya ohadii]